MRGIPEGGPASAGISMSDMQGPPIKEWVTMPDNPYTRMLDSISQGRATVSLPPPVPMPTEVPEPHDAYMPEDFGAPITRPAIIQPEPHQMLRGFDGVELRGVPAVIGDNNEAFPMTPEEVAEVSQLCLRVAERVMTDQLTALRGRFQKPKRRASRKG